ncbi:MULTISPECIES: Hsp70 family protein [Limnospira]|uniref:Hsp70 family protein n=1 Tax=Limnospira TaxID=2596745 RepID=UPI0014490885|nr:MULTISPECIES: Hsp70 family protein [unclassified Limnospira]MDT9187629.1 Hsp70 family protein [Limnospira sp. PMC 894.15]MDT9235873.1 Hsp70 family protein [Limnospira sp. PMC 917.15]QJB27625.1 Hsp70 family protein [Limnospira fusiformis SAG 85.79]
MSYDSEHNPVMGIDLGTTNSAIAYWKGEDRGPVSYEVDDGENTLQSVVYYDSDNSTDEQYQFLVGKSALRRGELNPSYMKREFKRRMKNASHSIILGGKIFSPIELSAEVLKKIYRDVIIKYPAGKFQARSTVVTVPYDFEEIACENTKQAARMANINFKELLQEPIAASLSYALDRVNHTQQGSGEEKILVFDLGGGTFDLTLFRLQQQPHKLIFEVLATGGHSQLGGIDFDECLTKFLLERSKISLENVRDVRQKRVAERKLKDAVIETKHSLTSTDSDYCSIADILPGQNLELKVKRQDFESSIEHYLKDIQSIMSQLWRQTQIQPNQVDRIILVGGSSRIPCIRQLLIENIGDKIYQHPTPDLCVAEGAAIYAAYLEDLRVFGNREVEIVTNGFDANISILNQQIEELRQQVSDLEIQLEDKKDKIQELEANLKDIQESQNIDDIPETIDPWNILEEKYSNNEIIDVQVTSINNGGAVVEVFNLQGFIPRSHLIKSHNQSLVGQLLKVVVLELTPNLLFSMLHIGQLGEGIISGIQPYGVFVEFNRLSGLLHKSQITNKDFDSIDKLFYKNQIIKAVIIKLENLPGERIRIALSTKILEEYPGEMLENMDKVMSEAEARLAQARQKLSL